MNKRTDNVTQRSEKRFRFDGKIKDILLLAVLALALVLAAWKIFYSDEKETSLTEVAVSENEEKISRLLQEIDGVGEASVMVCETEDGVQGAVVVCEGANDLQVVMNVREAVATALGTEQKSIKIYLKKE